MKSFWVIILLLTLLPGISRAQQDADDRYVSIYNVIQSGDNYSEGGQLTEALNSYLDAQAKLQKFQKIFPAWDPGIVSFRLDDLDKKIAALKIKTAPKVIAPAISDNGTAQIKTELTQTQVQLQSAQQENATLQAKLKEALATQPAAVDSTELAAAQQQLRDLMKQNDLLKASGSENGAQPDTNKISQLQIQLADAEKKLADENAHAKTLVDENTSLQRDLARGGNSESASLDLLHSENDRLKTQLASLQSAANNAAAADELAGKLKDARTKIANLEAAAALVSLEKAALENKVRKLSSELAESAANFDARIGDLTEQRNDLLKKLDLATAKNSRRKISDTAAQMTELNSEVNTLRARIAVDESKAIPYSPDELALFKAAPTTIEPIKRSIHEMPAGTAELVASAQQHFSNHEFDAAEADYQKILARDQNNGLALANLATIELQEDKLADAEKHIEAAVAQSPDDAYNLSTLGYLKFREEKYDEALDALSKAAKLDPNNPEIQNYLGVTLSHKGLRMQAETALRKAIELDGNYAPAHNNIAVIYLSQNPPLPQLARWHYQKALAAGQPHNPELEKMLADKGAPVEAQ